MALIKLTASELEGVKSQISKMSSKASDCANRTASVRNNLDMEISAKRNIEERLDNIKRDLTKHSESLKSYANVLNDVINEFVREDSNGNVLQLPDWAVPIGAAAGVIAGGIGINIPAHTGEMYNWQVQQQLEKLKNATKIFTDSSLEKEETGFWGNLWNKGKEAVESIGDKAKELYGNVVQTTKDCVSWVKESYDEKGIVYTVAQYGKTAVKVAGGVAAVGLSLATLVGTAGGSAPLAAASLAYGINDIVSGVKDAVDITSNLKEGGTAEFEENNLMKDGMEFIVGGAGGAIGEVLGNAELGEEIGEKIGAGLYDTGKIATTIYNISTGIDKIKQATDFNLSGIGSELDDAAKGSWDIFTKVEFDSIWNLKSDLAYQAKLLSYEIPNTMNAINNVSLINSLASSVIGEPAKIVEGLLKGETLEAGGVIGQVKDLITESLK